MATVKQYLDYAGLQAYDTALKNWANSVNQLGYKTILKSSDGNKLYFFTKPEATSSDITGSTPYVELGGGDMAAQLDSLASVVGAAWDSTAASGEGAYVITGVGGISGFDASVDTVVEALNELRSQLTTVQGSDSTSGSFAKAIKDAIESLDATEFALATVSDGVVTIKGIKEDNGVIAVGTDTTKDVTLAKVATTGAATDVSYSATIGSTSVTNVSGALSALTTLAGDGADSKTVYMTDDTSTSGTDYAKIYKIYQGSTGSSANPDSDELVGTINIPKDQFVESASLVDITFDSATDTLKDSSTDVTELIVGTGVTPTSADAGKYIKLVFAITTGSAAKSTVYISVKSLVDVYTGGTNAETTVSIDSSTNVVTATINKIAGTKVVYKAAYEDSTTGATVPEETVVDALNNIGSIPLTGATGSIASLFAAS